MSHVDELLSHGSHPGPARVVRRAAHSGRASPGQARLAPALRVLVIEAELPIRTLLRMGLSAQGYAVAEAATGQAGLEMLGRERPDLVILDLGLPDMTGDEVLRVIREREAGLPVIALSSSGDGAAKARALALGADDDVTKPFGIKDLLARVRAALHDRIAVQADDLSFRVGDLAVDLVRRSVRMGERDVRLSPKAYALLRVLVLHAGKVLTHAHILREIWGSSTDSQYVRIYVRQLRQKIEPDPDRPRYILTATGVGYRLVAPDEPAG